MYVCIYIYKCSLSRLYQLMHTHSLSIQTQCMHVHSYIYIRFEIVCVNINFLMYQYCIPTYAQFLVVNLVLFKYTCMEHVYIHMYAHIYIYIYIDIYTNRDPSMLNVVGVYQLCCPMVKVKVVRSNVKLCWYRSSVESQIYTFIKSGSICMH